jgi:hypothetical protein
LDGCLKSNHVGMNVDVYYTEQMLQAPRNHRFQNNQMPLNRMPAGKTIHAASQRSKHSCLPPYTQASGTVYSSHSAPPRFRCASVKNLHTTPLCPGTSPHASMAWPHPSAACTPLTPAAYHCGPLCPSPGPSAAELQHHVHACCCYAQLSTAQASSAQKGG